MPIAKSKSRAPSVSQPSLRVVAQPSDDKYQSLFDQASDAVMTIAPSGEIDDVNLASEEMTGYLKEELIGKNAQLLMPDPQKTRIPERARPLAMACFEVPGTYEDIVVLRKDGYLRMVEINVRHVSVGASTWSLVLLRDVGEKQRMERELLTKHTELRNAFLELEKKNAELQSMQDTLVQAGKMAALGELAAGIAHELNQPLTGIRGYAQEMAAVLFSKGSSLQAPARVEGYLNEIISNVDKMASIIQYLRTHVRKSGEDFRQTDVHQAIEEALKMLGRQLVAHGISVERDFQKDLPQVYGNPLQLEQVFINLASNARDAIDQTKRSDGKIIFRTRKLGECIEITVQDNGAGMSEKTKQRAFNPFFTTKEVGQGMGLGLSISYGVIAKLHGSMVIESELGKGTTFRILVPMDYREVA